MDGGVSADAQQDIMSRGVFLVDIMDVVGSHQGDIQFFADGDQFLVDALEFGDRLPLNLQVKIFKIIFIPSCRLPGFVQPVLFYQRWQFAAATGRESDKAFAVLSQNFLIDTGPVIEPFEVGLSNELNKVAITGKVFS